MRQFSIISIENSNSNFQCHSYERFRYENNFCGTYHMHPYSEFFFVTEGKGFFHLKNRKVPIQRGMLVINNGNIQHTESAHLDDELEYAVLCVNNLTIQSLGVNSEEQTFFFDFSKEYDVIFDFIRNIEREWNVREQFWQCALQTHFNHFILHVLRRSNLLGIPTQNAPGPNPLARVHLHLTACYADDISLDKLADMFCVNKYYLAHTFKAIYGDTIMNTLNKIRCETARSLLRSTDYSIGQIATGVGYNSSSHFAKIYGKIYGETPSQTRKKFLRS